MGALNDDVVGLLIKISSDSEDAQADIGKLRSKYDSELKAIESSGKNTFLSLGNSIGLSAEQMATMQVVLPAVGSAIATVTSAAIGLGAAIFQLAKNASDAGSQIHDLSEQTGLSATTISSIKFAADQSGSSIEEFAQGMTRFSRTVSDAAHGSDEAKEKLKRLGIDPQEALRDLDGALAKAFQKIYDSPAGVQQASVAMDAFGKTGDRLIPTINAAQGSLSGLIDRANEVGAVIDDRAAAAADQFGDTLDTLSAQARGMSNTIGLQVAPEVVGAMEDISAALGASKNSWKSWGEYIGDVIAGARVVVRTFSDVIRSGSFDPLSVVAAFSIESAAVQADRQQRSEQLDQAAREEALKRAAARSGGGGGGGGHKKKSEHDEVFEQSVRESEEQTRVAQETVRAKTAALQREYDQQLIDLEAYVKKAKQLADDRFNAVIDGVNRELRALETAHITKSERNRRQADIDQRTLVAQNARIEERQRIDDEAAQKRLEAERAFRQKIEGIANIADQREIARLKAQADEGWITHSNYEQQVLEIKQSQFNRRRALLDEEVDALRQKLKKQKNLNDEEVEQDESLLAKKRGLLGEYLLIEAQRAEAVEEATRRIADAVLRETHDLMPPIPPLGLPNTQNIDLTFGLGEPPKMITTLAEAFDDLGKRISKTFGLGGQQAHVFSQILSSSFNQVAQGIGAAVRAFVLLGNSGGGFRKFAAEVIASIAQMAVVQAVFELAQGLAMSALAWFTGNPRFAKSATEHYLAAAVFGSIGGVAAIAGRAIAGDAFANNASKDNGGTANSSGRSGTGSNDSTTIINEERRSAVVREVLVIRHEIEPPSGWVTKEISRDYHNNDPHLTDLLKDAARRY